MIFDTDIPKTYKTIKENIAMLKKYKLKVILIPQVENKENYVIFIFFCSN